MGDLKLTSFVAWLAVDSRAPTSLYFASDSRLSWRKGLPTWDTGRKLFATTTTAEIFGFVGYSLLPQTIISRACSFIDRNLRPLEINESHQACFEWLYSLAKSEIESHPNWKNEDFSIFYATCVNDKILKSRKFYMWKISWNSNTKELISREIVMPSLSGVLAIGGSGEEFIEKHQEAWRDSSQGNTSRAIFSAFFDSLLEGKDMQTGGEPQLIGLYTRGCGRIFGVVTESGASLEGILNPPINPIGIEWRDRLFQRVMSDGALVEGAQRHSRPRKIRMRKE